MHKNGEYLPKRERANTTTVVKMPQRADNENEDALQSDVALTTLFDVRGKVVVISGGGSGLGAMMATGFVRNGATVYIFSRKDTSHFAAELTAAGPGTCTAVVADAQRPATVEALVHRYVAL
jgi:NADP-dependent 3-hydroxy acid dehydrogenase YdfG